MASKNEQPFSSLLHEFLRLKIDSEMSSVNALQIISHADIHSFKKRNREIFQTVEKSLTDALQRLSQEEDYRVIGLYVALLVQDINLIDYCHSRLLKGKTGESAARLSAIVRQGLHAQATRQGRLPVWATSLIGSLVGIVVILLLLVAILAFVTSRL